jgi:hypothetical protein
MKTIITSPKGPPVRRVLCSFVFGAAAFCVVATNIQAAIQAPADIVWVTTGYTIAKYNANGTAINTNVITEPLLLVKEPLYRVGNQTFYTWYDGGQNLGGILVSGPILYVGTAAGVTWSYLTWILQRPPIFFSVIATYDAVTGAVIQNPVDGFPSLGRSSDPLGMALSAPYPAGPYGGPYLYVATQDEWGSISRIATTGGGNTGGDPYFISSIHGGPAPGNPYALAVGGPNGNILYVTNNAQNSNGDFYISTYSAENGALIKANFIQIKTAGLYGLALKNNVFGVNSALYVSVYGGNAPGVYTYDATTGNLLNGPGPFVRVNEPVGIAIGSPPLNAPLNGQHPTLYVASNQDSAIYEFDATTGARLSYSIKVNAPANITVEPATQQ